MNSNKVHGLLTISTEWGEVKEIDTLRCNHCQRIIRVTRIDGLAPDEYGWCHGCDEYICQSCFNEYNKDGECRHFMKQIEAEEKKDYERRTRGY